MGADGGKTRVVVTGLGAVTPVGNSVPDYWRAVGEGRSGVGPITRFDPKRLDSRIAAEVKGFDPLRVIEKKELKKLDLFIQYALAAGVEAVEDAKIDFAQVDPTRAGRARRLRDRRHPLDPRVAQGAPRAGAEPDLPVLHPVAHRQHGLRPALASGTS